MEDGRESYIIDIEVNKQSINELKNEIKKVQDVVLKNGADIDKAFETLSSAYAKSAKSVRDLEAEFKRLSAISSKAFASGDDKTYRETNKQIDAVKKLMDAHKEFQTVIQQEKADLEDRAGSMEGQSKRIASSETTMRTELRKTNEEMARMEQAGQRGSAAYQELAVKAAKLADQMGDTRRQIQILSSDEKYFQGVISGMNGVAGAASAAQGAMGLLVGENEDLQRVMLKVQSLMAITTGLQQVEQALNKDSAFRLVIVNGLKAQLATITGAYNAKLTEEAAKAGLASTANVGLAGSLRAVGAAMKAIPFIGWVAAIGSAVAGVLALTSKSEDLEEEQSRLAEQTKRVKEAFEDYSNNAAKGAGSLITKYNELRRKWLECYNSLQKKKFIEEQRDAMRDLGLKVYDVVTAESVFVNNTNRVINALRARAQMTALSSLEEQAYEDYYKEREKAEEQWGKDLKEANDKSKEYEQSQSRSRNVAVQQETDRRVKNYKKQQFDEANNNYAQRLIDAETEKNRKLNKVSDERIKLEKTLRGSSDVVTTPSGRTTRGGSGGGGSSNDTASDKAYEEKLKEQAIANERAKQARESEYRIRQAAIDGMEEGYAKQMAQINFDYDKELDLIKERGEEMVREAEKYEYEEWKQDKNNKGKKFTPTAGLTNEQGASINEDYRIAEEKRKRAMEALLTSLQDEFATVEARMEDIRKKYAEKRKMMYEDDEQTKLRKGFTQENVDNLNRDEQDAIDALNQEVASKEEAFQTWMDDIAKMSLDELRVALEEARKELDKAKSGTSAKDKAIASVKVKNAEKALKDAQKNIKPGDDAIKKWQELYKVVNKIGSEFDKLGDQIGGVAGEAIKTAGAIATSTTEVISGIATLVNGASTAIQTTSATATAAIKAMETASVILTIISAVLSVVSAISSSSSNDKGNTYIESLQNSNERLRLAIENLSDVMDKKSGEEAKIAYDEQKKMYDIKEKNTRKELASTYGVYLDNEKFSSQLSFYGIDGFDTTIQQLMRKIEVITNVSFNSMKEMFENLSAADWLKVTEEDYETYDKIVSQIEVLVRHYKGDDDIESLSSALSKFIDDYAEIQKQIDDKLLESLTGMKAGTIASEWQDMLTDMDASSKDFAEKFNEHLRDAIANSLIKTKYQKELDAIESEFSNRMEDGTLSATEAAELKDKYNEIVQRARDEIRQMYADTGLDSSSTDQSFSKGVGNMTEDTAEELNGRFTMLQVIGQQMAWSIDEIKALSYQGIDYMSQVARNTNELYSMNERLERIENNTRNL